MMPPDLAIYGYRQVWLGGMIGMPGVTVGADVRFVAAAARSGADGLCGCAWWGIIQQPVASSPVSSVDAGGSAGILTSQMGRLARW
ncbi:MAG: hypothetical protein NZ699_00755 [Roseiflexus sp.]|nr:hypothetical protein [Roseiflexus sp.]MCS7287639.1 hypothetical protein [Roseiflexus sp.]MDW8233730.1 hypothetical protein [Roseiflexaceae bacterium]